MKREEATDLIIPKSPLAVSPASLCASKVICLGLKLPAVKRCGCIPNLLCKRTEGENSGGVAYTRNR